MNEQGQKRKRGGGRAGNAQRRGLASIEQMPWHLPINNDSPIEPLNEDGIMAIHDGAMRILEEIGVEFLNEKALRILKKAGCKISEQNVRMDRHFVMEMVAKAPSTFDITPRNVKRKITVGGPHILFGNVSSPPAYWDLEIGKKIPGSRETFADFCKLSQYFNCIHFLGGYPVEPVDLHPSTRHLDAVFDKLILTDKVAHAYSLGKERVEDVMEMVRIAGNLSHEEFETSPKMFTNINSTSPLKHDEPMLDGWMRLAKKNQALIVTPFTLAGAMAPAKVNGVTIRA